MTKEQAERIQEEASALFRDQPGYSGSAVLFEIGEDQSVSDPKVHVFFEHEDSVEAAKSEAIPESVSGLPLVIEKKSFKPGGYARTHIAVPGDVKTEALVSRIKRRNPIQPGISVSHKNVTAGTFGLLVTDNLTGKAAILSNWHVLAGSAQAKAGDPIIQPGSLDTGKPPQDTVATLERSMLDTDGDAAIAILNGKRNVLPAQLETDALVTSAREPQTGELLVKSGRTTGVTQGVVRGFGSVVLTYSVGKREVKGMFIHPKNSTNPTDEEISSGGDSGSIWYSAKTHEGVGLHFAGETDPTPSAEHAVACSLPVVLNRLSVTIAASSPQVDAGAVSDFIPQMARSFGAMSAQALQRRLTPQQLRQYVNAMLSKYTWVEHRSEDASSDLDPAAMATALGFAVGAVTHLTLETPDPGEIGRHEQERFSALIAAFVLGAIAGGRGGNTKAEAR